MSTPLRIVRTEIAGRGPLDVRLRDGRVSEIGASLAPKAGELELDANGGALLPGLHDHHVHLFALAAAWASVRCGPPDVRSEAELVRAVRAAPGPRVRGVGYHESVAGDLDRARIDRIDSTRPVRIQHTSGALWTLNSRALSELGLDAQGDGRLFRADARLRADSADDPRAFPDLRAVSRELASLGVVGVSDATPGNGAAEWTALESAVQARALVQHVYVLGTSALPPSRAGTLVCGPVKLMLDDSDLPSFESFAECIRGAHDVGRGVAIHCVTRTQIVFALAALEDAGVASGDRIEHASVAPPEIVARLRSLGVCVVTQPNFLYERGDLYASEVDDRDRPWLYRARGLVEAGVPLGGGTDAPFGEPDPWRAMRAAVERRTRGGHVLAPGERLEPERALALFTTAPEAPGGAPRRVRPSGAADLCLLDRPWSDARRELSRDAVRATWISGEMVWER